MAYELILGTPPPPLVADVSTDRDYLAQRLSSYDPGWLGDWPVTRIREHQKGHENGHVWMGKRLARVFRRDSNVIAALGQRVAPWLGCQARLDGGDDNLRAELEPQIGPGGPLLSSDILRDTAEDLAMCGMAIWHHPWKPRADGTRWDPQVEVWNLEAVGWDGYARTYYTQTRERGRVPITHGDGLWTIIRSNQLHPHEHGAVIPLAIHVASRVSTILDRNTGSRAIGMPKMIGTLPEGVQVKSPEGKDLDSALNTFMQGLSRIVVPKGTEIDKVEFGAAGLGQFFEGTIKTDRTDIFFALTGQDGSAQSAGGNYQKAQVLEAVLYAWIVADTTAGATGITSGLLRPYAAINRGDASLAPSLSWPLPDPDEDARIDSYIKREEKLVSIVQARRAAGFVVTQTDVDALARELRVTPPRLADVGTKKELFAYHQRGGLFTRNEIRESRGYEPLPSPEGEELVNELVQDPAETGQA